MEDDLGPRVGEDRLQRVGVADVRLHETDATLQRAVEILPPPGREVVDHDHLVAALDQRVDEVRPDESGAACHKSPHAAQNPIWPPPRLLPSLPEMAGLFVTFEGVDRAGKTTQAGMLRDALGDRAVAV